MNRSVEASMPSNWTLARVRDVLEINYGKGLKASDRDDAGDIPVYGSNGIVGRHSEALIRGPCIVIGRKGAAGAVHISKSDCWPIDTTYYAHAPTGMKLDYLFYVLSYINLAQLDRSTAIPGLNRDDLYDQVIPVPPTDEQVRIVEKLEELLSQFDAGVEVLRRAEANINRYRAAVLRAAYEGRLVPTEAELASREGRDYELGSALLERISAERQRKWEMEEWSKLVEKAKKKTARARRRVSGRPARLSDLDPDEWQGLPQEAFARNLPDDQGWKQSYRPPDEPNQAGYPELPAGWLWVTIDQIADVIGGLTKNPKRKKLPEKIPYLRVANVYANTLLLDDVWEIGIKASEKTRILLEKGDMLVVEGNGSRGQIGRVALWDASINPCAHQNHLIKVRFHLPEIGKFVLFWLLSLEGRNQITQVASSTSGLYTLNLSKVASLSIPLPPLAEQKRITSEIEKLMSITDKVLLLLGSNSSKTQALKRSIVSSALDGCLVEQDPDDEPAIALLERIRNEMRKPEYK